LAFNYSPQKLAALIDLAVCYTSGRYKPAYALRLKIALTKNETKLLRRLTALTSLIHPERLQLI
jgi:hypothetical protein